MFQKVGFAEIAVLLVVALLIFGPSKLPALGKSIGDTMREFKKSMKEISSADSTEEKKA